MIEITQRNDRLRAIIGLLRDEPFCSVKTLSLRFNVSEATVRRDLADLSKDGALQRVRGGILSPRSLPDESPFGWRYHMQRAEKQAIAEAANGLVHEGDTVALDIGTTPLYVARILSARQITVVTNSLKAADVMGDGRATVVVTGGSLRVGERSLLGSHALSQIRRFRFDVFLMSAGGVSRRGVTDYHVQEVEAKQEFMQRAERTVVLVDSTKFGRRSGLIVADVPQVSLLLTAGDPDPEALAEVREAGGRVEVVDPIDHAERPVEGEEA